jgi:hypothetical protein
MIKLGRLVETLDFASPNTLHAAAAVSSQKLNNISRCDDKNEMLIFLDLLVRLQVDA